MSKCTVLLLGRVEALKTRGQLVLSDHLLTTGPAAPTKPEEGGVPVSYGTVSQGHGVGHGPFTPAHCVHKDLCSNRRGEGSVQT